MYLEPDETKKANIEVMKKDLMWYNPKNKAWDLEKMDYTISVGPSSMDKDLLSTNFNIS